MAAGLRVEQVAELQLAFPTFTEAVSVAAQKICRAIGVGSFPPGLELPRDGRVTCPAAAWFAGLFSGRNSGGRRGVEQVCELRARTPRAPAIGEGAS